MDRAKIIRQSAEVIGLQNIKIDELVAQLKMDPSLSVLFVEGLRDLSFWRKYVPIRNRVNRVVYAACVIDLDEKCEGGEKGKLLKLIKLMKDNNVSDRVRVFVDADNDRLLGVDRPDNVVSTDFRDLESYAFDEDVLAEMAHTGLAKNDLDIRLLMDGVEAICLPIGYLRYLSEKEKYLLPFNRTFENDKRKKYVHKVNGTYVLKAGSLVNALLQNANITLSKADKINSDLSKLIANNAIDVKQVIHGKDWVFYMALLCGVGKDVIEPLVFVCLDYSLLDANENIFSIKRYLMGVAA